jgi:hypothetical protein
MGANFVVDLQLRKIRLWRPAGMIPPPAQRMMAERVGAKVREEAGSHAIYVSKPQPVADIIEAAAG